jgi:hypothetical protein
MLACRRGILGSCVRVSITFAMIEWLSKDVTMVRR